MRFRKHPILDFKREKQVKFKFEGRDIIAYKNEPIAAALHAAGIDRLSDSLRFNRPRGFYCAIGKCASCVMEVNNVPNVRTCITPVEENMIVKRQNNSKVEKVDFKGKKKFEGVKTIETDFAVIGGGPAGLSASIYASKYGIKTIIFEENYLMGGQLIKQTHKFFGSKSHYASVRGIDIADKLLNEAEQKGVEIKTSASVIGFYPPDTLGVVIKGRYYKVKAKNILIATGASEKMIPFSGNDLPGVYGAGAIQTLMNVYGIAPGNRVLIVGAGNIGVIVAYQLIQAGIDVVAVIEALPVVGAYLVHSAKLMRMGVPILTKHTIKKALGEKRVGLAKIVELDDKWQHIKGSEKEFEVDTIGLAVGLTPSVEILAQGGAKMAYINELGGYVALHNRFMQTSFENVFVAGDVACIEEASSAMMEGRIAGLTVVERIKGKNKKLDDERAENIKELNKLRNGIFGEKVILGNKKLFAEARNHGIM